MGVENAIRAVAIPGVANEVIAAWHTSAELLHQQGVTNNKRKAMLIGQCALESARFSARFENLNYSASALWGMFGKYFDSEAETQTFALKPQKIANRIYSNRMGNGDEASGDGYRFRGRGYLQLTGKSNYRRYGNLLGIDLIAEPDLVAAPEISWQVAALYCANRSKQGKNLFQWADAGDTRMVTRGINGGTHGLADRISKTEAALSALQGKLITAQKQQLLAANGFTPGPIDGLPGNKTRSATKAAEAKFGIAPPELWSKLAALLN